MKASHTAALLGCLAVGIGAGVCWRLQIRTSLKEFAQYALYMAVMDDEICRNELEGNQIGDAIIRFPHKMKTLQERYHHFLKINRKRSRRQLRKDIAEMERRLRDSRQYTAHPKQRLELVFE